MNLPDRVRIHPAALGGSVHVPGDKSLSHRALILGALAEGVVEISGAAPSADVLATAAALRTLGADVALTPDDDSGQLGGTVTGPLREPDRVIDCGNSGTSLRLLSGVVAGLDGLSVLTGDASLSRRPVGRVAEPLRRMGAEVDARAGGTLPPLVVRGGRLHGLSYTSPVASAQVKSCVLLAGLAADGRTSVVSPGPSRDHTERMIRHLGGEVERTVGDDGTETVHLQPTPLQARPLQVPADPSSAAFWLVAAAVGTGDGITVTGICANPTRTGVLGVLRELGADVAVTSGPEAGGEPTADVTVRPADLGGAVVEGPRTVDTIDELVVLALAGALSHDGLEVRDAAELRVKESDRIRTLATALRALGLEIDERDDGYRVRGQQQPRAGVVDAHGDHRIAMTAAIAGTLATGPVEITGFASVATSYPSFLDDLERLGGRAEVLARTG